VYKLTRLFPSINPVTCLFSIEFVWHALCFLYRRRQSRNKQGDAMKALLFGKVAMMIVTAMALAVQAMAQQAPKRIIVVSLEDRKLALIEDGKVKKIYSVAVGKPSTPSPVGTFAIERRIVNPTYHHNGKTVPPGPHNPVGARWMGLSIQGYGIHGTNEPNSIGKAASHGCIRMAKADVEEIFDLVEVGDTVELVGKRNEETAQLFGDQQKPSAVAVQCAECRRSEGGCAP
jgi:lipoprotein-anchoring transpeptidase ErfK/SrfK